MNWHRFCVFIFVASMALLGSCQMDRCGDSPEGLIRNMEALVATAKSAGYEAKSDRWNSLDEQFRQYYEECYDAWRGDMTIAQKSEFAGLVTRYVTHRFGRSFFRSIFKGNKAGPESEQEFFESLGRDLDQFIEENRERIFDGLFNQ